MALFRRKRARVMGCAVRRRYPFVSHFRQDATATRFDTSRANYCLPRPALCRVRWVGRGLGRLRRPQ
jgi:hypothetical protein